MAEAGSKRDRPGVARVRDRAFNGLCGGEIAGVDSLDRRDVVGGVDYEWKVQVPGRGARTGYVGVCLWSRTAAPVQAGRVAPSSSMRAAQLSLVHRRVAP